MKKGIIILMVFLLSISIVTAYDEGYSLEEISADTIIEANQVAEYNLKLSNLGPKTIYLQLRGDEYAGLPSSDFEYVFVDPKYVEMSGNEVIDVTVSIKLKEDVPTQKRYKTYITIITLGEETSQEQYPLEVFAIEPKQPITVALTEKPGDVAPGNDVIITIDLLNNLNEDLGNVDIYYSSEIFEEQHTVQLFSKQEREVEFSFPVSNSVSPGDYSYSIRVYYEEDLTGAENGTFTVAENLDIKEITDYTEAFLLRTHKITITNEGNSRVSHSYEMEMGLLARSFASYNIEPSVKKGVAYWGFSLEPGEEVVIDVNVNYRTGLVGAIIFIFIILIIYYVFTKRVTIRKEVFKLKYSDQGIADFKILLHVKNNTNKPIKDLTLVDLLPQVIRPSMDFGTLRPTGVQKSGKQVRMMWKINELVSGEERVISYKVQPRMSVIGRLTLPAALGKFKNEKNRVVKTRSNKPFVYSGVAEKTKKE